MTSSIKCRLVTTAIYLLAPTRGCGCMNEGLLELVNLDLDEPVDKEAYCLGNSPCMANRFPLDNCIFATGYVDSRRFRL